MGKSMPVFPECEEAALNPTNWSVTTLSKLRDAAVRATHNECSLAIGSENNESTVNGSCSTSK